MDHGSTAIGEGTCLKQTAEKIHQAQLRGLRAAEERTKLTLFSAGTGKRKGRA
jgi:hypothetical protein